LFIFDANSEIIVLEGNKSSECKNPITSPVAIDNPLFKAS